MNTLRKQKEILANKYNQTLESLSKLGKRKSKGFTLTEVIVAIAIGAILVTAGVYQFTNGRKAALDSNVKQEFKNVSQAGVDALTSNKPLDNAFMVKDSVYQDGMIINLPNTLVNKPNKTTIKDTFTVTVDATSITIATTGTNMTSVVYMGTGEEFVPTASATGVASQVIPVAKTTASVEAGGMRALLTTEQRANKTYLTNLLAGLGLKVPATADVALMLNVLCETFGGDITTPTTGTAQLTGANPSNAVLVQIDSKVAKQFAGALETLGNPSNGTMYLVQSIEDYTKLPTALQAKVRANAVIMAPRTNSNFVMTKESEYKVPRLISD